MTLDTRGTPSTEAARAVVSNAAQVVSAPPAPPSPTTPATDDPFQLLFENSLDAIVIADDEGRFLDVNPPAADLFGYSREEMLSLRVGDLVISESPGAAERYAHYVQTGREAGELTFVRPDKDVRIASYSACRLAPGRHLSILRDLTVQKREQAAAAEQLARQARLFDTALSSIVDFAYVFDRNGCFVYVNKALLDLWQLRLEDALGKNFHELNYPSELAERLQNQIQSVFDTGQPLRDETPYTGAAGIKGYYEYIFVPVFDREGNVEVVAGSTRDITERQRELAEKERLLNELEHERARLAELFMQAPAFIAVLRGPEHIFERVNGPYMQLVGHRDLTNRPLREVFPDLEGQGFFEILDDVYRTGKPYVGSDVRILLQEEPDGDPREHYLDFVYQPLVEADESVSGIFAHGVDLTARKRVEEALRDRQAEIERLNGRLRRAMVETHHRVKNNLQLISAFIDIQTQSGAESVPMSALTSLGQNIQALGVIHDILTAEAKVDGDAAVISVKKILEEFLPLLKPALGGRELRVGLDELSLPGRQATSLTLVINELISNAAKHGKSDVDLTLRVEGSRATLRVCDDGPGFPPGFDPKTSANTGLELIETIARHDLDGQTTYGNQDHGGACVTLTFPVP
jgi:PAS domain S-box-containing protein